jgi:hypothetical protein
VSKEINTESISRLIYKSIIKSLKKKEKENLQDWLKDESNEKLYAEIVSSNSIYKKRALYQESNKEKVFEIIHKKINRTNTKSIVKRRFFRSVKYAASIIILFAIGNSIYKANFDTNAITQEAIKNINPGYEKATLVLSDGTTIDLEEHKNEFIVSDNIQVKNEEKGLVYNAITKTTSIDNVTRPLKYNTLKVPRGGMYQVVLSDGTKVWLNSETSLTYPERFDGEQRIVQLEGEAYFEVTKDVKEFIVKTNVADVTVLGTQFNVSSYKDNAFFSSTLVEGKIKLATSHDKNKDNSLILAPNQRGLINKNSSKIQFETVDTEVYTAWKEGKFYFEKERLESILKSLGRWYNIDIVFEDESLKKEMFTGVAYKDRQIDNLLDMISKTTRINYIITQNKINNKYELKLSRNQ